LGVTDLVGVAGCANVFSGDFENTYLNASNTVTGGDPAVAGTSNIVKIYGTYNAAKLPSAANLKNIDTVEINSQVAAANYNFLNFYTKAVNGVTKYIFDDASLLSTNTITTGNGQALSLSTGASNLATVGTVTWAGSTTDTSLNLILNGYQGLAATPFDLTVTGVAATTLNIASTGAANKVGVQASKYFTGPTTVTTHTITGDQAFSYVLAAADAAAVTSIDASAATGNVSANLFASLTPASFIFKGGSGNDKLTFIDNNLGRITLGSQIAMGAGSADKISTYDTVFSAAEYTALNAATGVEVLGLNAAVTVAATSLTSIKQFSVDTTALTQVINGLATGSSVTFNAVAPTSMTLTGDTGVTDVTIALGVPTSTTSMTVGTLVPTALTTVAMSSNGSGSKTNTITAFTNASNSTITVTGTQPLTFTLANLATVNASALTGALTIVGSAGKDVITGTAKNDSFTGMAGGDIITAGGGTDTAVYTVAAQTFAATAVVVSGTTVLTGVDTYSGLNSGDKITMYGAAGITASTAISTSLIAGGASGTVDTIALVRGDFNVITNIFTANTSGADVLLQWDADGVSNTAAVESAVIYGFGGGTVTLSADTITLN
jgi:hypothetical protein